VLTRVHQCRQHASHDTGDSEFFFFFQVKQIFILFVKVSTVESKNDYHS
jgi:hypothetical protein